LRFIALFSGGNIMLLYTYPENFRAYKALIAAQYSGANVKVAPNFEFTVTNKTEAFLKKFPLGKVRTATSCISERIFSVS
jgi:elongation factor 1-gamma